MCFRVKGQYWKYFWDSSLLDRWKYSHQTFLKPCFFWSNGALIYLFHSALIEGLFGQVQHVWQGCNSCHWIKRWGWGGRRDWWEKGDGGAFVWAAATSCTSPINLCPGDMQRIAFAFHLLAVPPIWCFWARLSSSALFIFSPRCTLK